MGRKKGSKNKKKVQFVEDAKVVEQPKKEDNPVAVVEQEDDDEDSDLNV